VPNSTVARNFDLLRWKYGTHKALQKRLQKHVSWQGLSDLALGRKTPANDLLRSVERELSLPAGWFERDNVSLAILPSDEYALMTRYRALGPKERRALLAVAEALSAA